MGVQQACHCTTVCQPGRLKGTRELANDRKCRLHDLFLTPTVPVLQPQIIPKFLPGMKQYQPESDSDSDGAPEEVVKGHKHIQEDVSDEDGPSSSGRSHSSSEAADSDAESDDLDQQEQALEQRLAEVPLEAVTKQLKDGKGPTGAAARAAAFAANKQVFHRETKNRPQEMSSKKPVSRSREVIQVPKQ